jgi:hypothetical protein
MEARAHFLGFVNQMDRYNMPVKFLRLVLKEYSFGETSGQSKANAWTNNININRDTLNGIKQGFGLGGPTDEAKWIATLYHESAHALLDLKEDDPKFKNFIRDGTAYYKGAPLQGGGVVTDGEDVLHEAVGSYVGDRAFVFYQTWDRMESLYGDTINNGNDKALLDRRESQLRELPAQYDRDMQKRVYGYQAGRFSAAVDTTQSISASIKAFCDEEILEGKIKDAFEKTPLKARLDEILSEIAKKRAALP